MTHEIEGGDFLILSILVLFLGIYLTEKIAFLKRNNIPAAVTGGLISALPSCLPVRVGVRSCPHPASCDCLPRTA